MTLKIRIHLICAPYHHHSIPKLSPRKIHKILIFTAETKQHECVYAELLSIRCMQDRQTEKN